MAASTLRASMLSVWGSMSTKTGVAPTRAMQPAVAKNENGVVITSSPALMSSAISASTSASVPLETLMACLKPKVSRSSLSKASTSGPMMK